MTDEHDPVEYRDFEATYTGDPIEVTWAEDRSSFSVASPCPQCRAVRSKIVRQGTPNTKGITAQTDVAAPALPDEVTFICACGFSHASRPKESEDSGCGAVWKVPVK
jgi:hypothetical protein